MMSCSWCMRCLLAEEGALIVDYCCEEHRVKLLKSKLKYGLNHKMQKPRLP